MSELRGDYDAVVRQSTEPFILEFISATDIPLFDGKSKSDPFLQAFISTHTEKLDSNNRRVFQLQRVSNLVQTPSRQDCTSVIWHCYRDFNVKPSTEAVLTVELYHKHKEVQKSIMLGKLDIPVSKLVDEEPVKFPLYAVKGTVQGKNPNFSVTLRRVFTSTPAPIYRTFFLIRHGESKWNEAQSKINITGMLDRDHPLTEDGINQACALNARWRLAKSQGKTKYAEAPNMRASMCSELIDFTKLGEEDLIAMGGGDGDDGSGDEGEEGEKEKGNRLGKLYDTFFQRYSNVTAAGKPRQPNGSAPSTPSAAVTPPPATSATKGPGRASYVPSFLDSEILDFTTSDSPAHSRSSSAVPAAATANLLDLEDVPASPSSSDLAHRPMPPLPILPAVADPFDLLDGYTDLTISSNSATNTSGAAGTGTHGDGADDRSDGGTDNGEEDSGGDDDDLPQRREEYIRLFMRADIVYVSPLTRAVQTALAAMCGHQALAQRKLTLYSIIREIKRIGGMDTVGVEFGAGIMRRVKAELQLAMGVARAHEITDFVKTDVNDADSPWWTSVSSFETDREQLDRVREFLTFSRYCEHNLPVFVGHSLFFKAFCSSRISAVMTRKRPHLSANLKKYRLSNASLLAVTVKYMDLDNGCSEAVVVDADLLFGGGFHGVKLAHDTTGHNGSSNSSSIPESTDIDGAMQLPPPSQAARITSTLHHSINHKVSRGSQAIGKRTSMFASSITNFLSKDK